MKFTLSWLKDHLETGAALGEIVEALNGIGLEVENVDDRSALAPFVIARVVEARAHPNADRLKVLDIDAGGPAPVQVVCGAPNARAGLVGVFAPPGTWIPGTGHALSSGTIRGVESRGMMCSERELQLSNEHDGIIELDDGERDGAKAGTGFAAHAGLDDPVIEIGLTPNRPDCAGVRGIARDLAALGLGTMKDVAAAPVDGDGPCPVTVSLAFGEAAPLCRGFALRLVRGLRNGPGPAWMRQRLTAIGLRPINALVDITNYVTFDRGRPLHVFDAAKVRGDLTVRRGKAGETLRALDGREYPVDAETCVIADGRGVESLAGIIGGERSGCTDATVDVLIESALWDPVNIARTGRRLGIGTDARYRFERGVDPAAMVEGLELASRRILDLCGGVPSEPAIAGERIVKLRTIAFPPSEVERLTGLDVPASTSLAILRRLGFETADRGETTRVTVPTWRPDIDGKADLVEEVMRIYGVDRIDSQPLPRLDPVGRRILTALQARVRLARRCLAARGMMEAITWSFVGEDLAALFGGGDLELANPIAADMTHMRPSLLPGLIVAARRNASRGNGDVALFEVADRYGGDADHGQRRVAAGIRRGTAKPGGAGRHWTGGSPDVDVFDAKADALAVLAVCGVPVDRVRIATGAPDWFHPGRSGLIAFGPNAVLAAFGEFHPGVLARMDAAGPLCGFEVALDVIGEPKRKATPARPPLSLSPLHTLRRDFAFVVDRSVAGAQIVSAVTGADRKMIAGVSVFDVFEDASIGAGSKSIAVEVTIRQVERTLRDADLEALAERIVASVAKRTGGRLRA